MPLDVILVFIVTLNITPERDCPFDGIAILY